jgi:hypothetical protein
MALSLNCMNSLSNCPNLQSLAIEFLSDIEAFLDIELDEDMVIQEHIARILSFT